MRQPQRTTTELVRWAQDLGTELVTAGQKEGLTDDDIVIITAMLARLMRRAHPNPNRRLRDRQDEAEAVVDVYDGRVLAVA